MGKLINDQTLADELGKGGVVVLEIGAPGCGPCKALKKTLSEIEPEFEGKAIFLEGDMGAGDIEDTCMAYRVMSAPTLLIFKDGSMTTKKTGAVKKDDIVSAINELL